MRTTVRLPDQLMRRAKARAAESGRTLTQLIEDAVRRELDRPDATGDATVPYVVDAVDGRGVRPGVDLDDSAGLLDIMEQP